MTEDLGAFMADFGVDATYDGATTVRGIFDAEYGTAFGQIAPVAGTQPAFLCKAADVAADPRGKTLAVSATNYTIRDYQPDLTGGLVTLVLERA